MAAKSLQMSDGEILADFRQAKNKREQVEILADQCLVSPLFMAKKLRDLGALEGTGLKVESFPNRYKPISGKTQTFDELRAMELFKEGYDDIAMSEALGISVKRVQAWRSRMHLKRPQGRPKKSTEEEAESVESLHAMDPATGKETVIEAAQAAAEPAPPEPENEAEELTTGGFIQLLMQLTNSRTLTKPLVINGSRVNGISRLIIDGSGDAMTVKVETC